LTDFSCIVDLGKELATVFQEGSLSEQDFYSTREFLYASLHVVVAHFSSTFMACLVMSCNYLSASTVTNVTGVTFVGSSPAGVAGVTCVESTSSVKQALAMSSLRITTLAAGFATSSKL
jgi:hypothetical protein